MVVDRVRVSAIEIDRWRVSEGGTALPRCSFAPTFVAKGVDFRQWNSIAGAAIENEGNTDTGGYYIREIGDTRAKIRVDLDAPSGSATSLAFTITGTAVASTHYTLATPSPITIPAYQEFAEIWVEVLEPSKFYTEKSIILTLDEAGSTGLSVDTDGDEFRLYLRPSVEPPTIEFDAAANTQLAPGTYNVGLTLSAASLETTTIYYRESGTIDSANYSITAGDESGALTIAPGATTATLEFTIAGGAGSGDTLIFTLNHELNTVKYTASPRETFHADENQMHFTTKWDLEQGPYGVGKEWPADPTMWGNAGLIEGATADHPDGETSLRILQAADITTTPASAPDGGDIDGLTISPLLISNVGVGYIRESFEDGVKCGGPASLSSMLDAPSSVRLAVRIGTWAGADTWRKVRFFNLSFRVRSKGPAHWVTIDRESTLVNRAGDTLTLGVDAWTMGTETWGLWDSFLLKDDAGVVRTTVGAIRQRFDGEGDTVATGGTEVNTMWLVHDMGGTYTANGETFDEVGGDLGNSLLYPIKMESSDGTNFEDVPLENIGAGTPMFWPWFEISPGALSGPPTKYWHKPGRWWEPRGYAALVATDTLVHTFTVT